MIKAALSPRGMELILIGNWDAFFFFRCLNVIQIFISSAVPSKLPLGSFSFQSLVGGTHSLLHSVCIYAFN